MKIRLNNTPNYGTLLLEYYNLDNSDIADFFGGVFGVTNMDNKHYLYRGSVSDCNIYSDQIKKLNTKNYQFVKITEL